MTRAPSPNALVRFDRANNRWVVQRSYARYFTTAALWLGRIAVLTMGIAVALIVWELALRKLLGWIATRVVW